MLQLTEIIQDEEMGAVPFVVQRRHMIQNNGETESVGTEEITTCGVVQPTRDQDLILTPEEYRSEKLMTFYAPVPFSLGHREDAIHFTAPDRILYESREYLVIAVKDWLDFGFSRAIAVEKKA